MDFFNRGSIFMDYECIFWPEIETSLWICFLQTGIFSLHKTLTDSLDYL